MLKAFAQKIQPIWKPSINGTQSLKHRLIQGAIGSFGLKIAGSGLAFVLSVILARVLGSEGLGTYAYAMIWANLVSIPATLGIDQLIVREMAIYRAKSQWKLMRGLLRWSTSTVLVASLGLTLIAVVIAWSIQGNNQNLVLAVFLAMTIVPLASLRNLRLGAMRGLDCIVLGQIPDALFAPVIVIVLIALGYGLFPHNFGVYWVLASKITAIVLTFFIGTLWLRRSLPDAIFNIKPQYQCRQWLLAALPFMFLGTVELINSRIDIIMLGGIEGVAAVGIYTVIFGITQLTAFVHQAALGVLGPTIANLYAQGKLSKLEQVIQKSILGVFLISLVIGGAIIGCSKYVLLIFGAEFVSGALAMNILIGGQMFNALTGPVGLVLNMTGHQRQTAIATGIGAILNIMLNAILIPFWGINGAAIATTISMIAINMIKVILIRQRLGISLYSLPKLFSDN
ncbi:MAG: flippase [Cyanobacteria bacterium J06638_38]